MKLSDLTLLYGAPVVVDGAITIRQPPLRELVPEWELCQAGLSLLCMTSDDFFESIHWDARFGELTKEDEKNLRRLTPFEYICMVPEYRSLFLQFCARIAACKVEYDEEARCFNCFDADILCGRITADNFSSVKRPILQIFCIEDSEDDEPELANAAAQRIFETMKKFRKEAKAKKKESHPGLSLENVISAVASYHPSLNLLNIWDLTLYQLYNQFFRLNRKQQLDAYTTKWSVWGKDSFDFDMWFASDKS